MNARHARILELTREGWSISDIAAEVGVCRGTVGSVRSRNGVTNPVDPEKIAWRREQVARLSRFGWTVERIAARLRVSERTVERDRVALGLAKTNPPRLSDTEAAIAERLLDDGCSYNEVARTLGRSASAIANRFPGRAWSRTQSGQFAIAIRYALAAERSTRLRVVS